MKRLNARTLSLVGFAASQWASERLNGSRHRKQYRQLVAAGLVLHEQPELYAAAPKMRRALATIARHAAPLAVVVLLAGCAATPNDYNTEQALPVLTIDIRSIPTGAVIYMNAEYVGTTPLQLKVVADKFGNWQKPTRFQAYVPHDTQSYEEALYPSGSRVPSRLLLRVPRYTHWYSATQPKAPQTAQTLQVR